MPDEINTQDSTLQVNPVVLPEVPVTNVPAPVEVASDTPVSVVDIPSPETSSTPVSVVDVPAADASSTPVSEPVVVPVPVEVAPVDAPVVIPPGAQTAPTATTSRFDQNKSGWREFLPKAWAGKKKKQLDKIAKVYAYIVKNKKATTLRLRLYMLCRRETIEDYLSILIKENKIRRVGSLSSPKVYYEPVL
jgi:hypothetical protein